MVSEINPVYYTDEYPRKGCKLEIEVKADRCGLSIFAPDGKIIESYFPPRGEVGRYVQEWLGGIVPRVRPAVQNPGQLLSDKAD